MKFPGTVQLVNTICHRVIEERVDQNFIPPRAALHSQVPNCKIHSHTASVVAVGLTFRSQLSGPRLLLRLVYLQPKSDMANEGTGKGIR
ncbi:hypothetical protein TIFTF001_018462 [Ficus carica]|uniref:Uncharacterized protein n=1 Tax=Ficus carica TaxID=3494 RepID=A0AA88DAT2_FICCA|nr:hypothetical protein TIFTF001_018462 [Ficus carica]